MDTCKALKGYSIFVDKVRKYRKEGIDQYNESHSTPLNILADISSIMKTIVSVVVERAIDECIKEDILRSFFTEYRKEVHDVAILEYSAEKHIQFEKEDSYNTGFNNGCKIGVSTGVKNVSDLFSWLKRNGREADILMAVDDPELLDEFFKEFAEIKNQ